MKAIRAAALFCLVFLASSAVLAEGKGDFCFAVFGDTRPTGPMLSSLTPAAHKIVEEIGLIGPDLQFFVGDMVWGYKENPEQVNRDYDMAMRLFSTLRAPIYYAPGNHEYGTLHSQQEFFRRTGQKEYFAVDYLGVHFIVLNTEIRGHIGAVEGAQLEWLKRDLESHKDSRAIFVFMHRPMFARMGHATANNTPPTGAATGHDDAAAFAKGHPSFAKQQNKDELAALFARYKVKAVFAGHEHLFAKTLVDDVRYFTVGGGGAEFAVPPDEGGFLNYMVVRLKGDEIIYDVMEPYHFFVECKYDGNDAAPSAEVRVDSIHYRKSVIALKGIMLTLPPREYVVSADTIPPYSIMKGFAPKPAIPKVKASIWKMEKSKTQPDKMDVFLDTEVGGGYSILIKLVPK